MGFIRGNQTITPSSTYLFATIRYYCSMVTHLVLIMPGTIKRNFTNNTGSYCAYYPSLAFSAIVLILSNSLDIILVAATFFEFLFTLVLSPIGIIIYPISQREDSINTAFNTLENIWPLLEFHKFDTVIQLELGDSHCSGSCGRVHEVGLYREVDWACERCLSFMSKLKELNASPEIFRRIHIRGRVVSEYSPFINTAPRLIQQDGLKNLMTREFLLFSTYDTAQFKWKRVYIRARPPLHDTRTYYELKRHRTERITHTIQDEGPDYIALKSFSIAARDWNKLGKSNYNNQNRQFVKVSGSAILLGIQAALGLLQINNEDNHLLRSLAIAISAQLAWFQILSEVFLADVPLENITAIYFDRVSSARAKAIRYVDRGDWQSIFSAEALSWYTATTLTGMAKGKPVTPMELLLNANRVFTRSEMYTFSQSGATCYKHAITVCTEGEGAMALVSREGNYLDTNYLSDMEPGNFLVT